MKQLKTDNLLFTLIIIILVSTSSVAQRGLRVGYIDMDYILENIPEYRQASQMLDQKIQEWQKDISIKQTKIDNLKEKLENERPLLTSQLIEEKEDEIQFLQQELLDFRDSKFGASGDFIIQKRQLIQPVEDQVFNAIQEIGNVREYDFIFENSSEALLLFSAKRHDISDRVLKMINRSATVSERMEQKPSNKSIEKEKNQLQEIAEEPYQSVKEAKAEIEKEKEREKENSKKERVRDSINDAREKVRDSIRQARQDAFEKRRLEVQKRRDSINKARENK